jgi:hypothetical protein
LSDTVINMNPGETMGNSLGYQIADFTIDFAGSKSGNFKNLLWSLTGFMASTSFVTWMGGGYCADPIDITGFGFLLSTGTFSQGHIYLYGMRKGA